MDEIAPRPRTLLQRLGEHGLNVGAASLGVALLVATGQQLLAGRDRAVTPMFATAAPGVANPTTGASAARVSFVAPRLAATVTASTRHAPVTDTARQSTAAQALRAQSDIRKLAPAHPAPHVASKPVPHIAANRSARTALAYAAAAFRTMPEVHWHVPVRRQPTALPPANGRYAAGLPVRATKVAVIRTMPDVHWRIPSAKATKIEHHAKPRRHVSATAKRPVKYDSQPALAKIATSTALLTLAPAALPMPSMGRHH